MPYGILEIPADITVKIFPRMPIETPPGFPTEIAPMIPVEQGFPDLLTCGALFAPMHKHQRIQLKKKMIKSK